MINPGCLSYHREVVEMKNSISEVSYAEDDL